MRIFYRLLASLFVGEHIAADVPRDEGSITSGSSYTLTLVLSVK